MIAHLVNGSISFSSLSLHVSVRTILLIFSYCSLLSLLHRHQHCSFASRRFLTIGALKLLVLAVDHPSFALASFAVALQSRCPARFRAPTDSIRRGGGRHEHYTVSGDRCQAFCYFYFAENNVLINIEIWAAGLKRRGSRWSSSQPSISSLELGTVAGGLRFQCMYERGSLTRSVGSFVRLLDRRSRRSHH